MIRGRLSFKGSIDLNQFWPQNIRAGVRYDSDADTVKVKIDPQSVQFTSPAGGTKKTTVLSKAGFFHNIKSKNGTVTNKFKPVIDANGMINMRLQGIDAPELHYDTGTPLYRQHMGESSTVALYNYLKGNVTGTTIACEVFTQVNRPNDIFDKYGRCVGDIVINEKGGKSQNVNQWLIKNGYAFPAFYNSMTPDEITTIRTLADDAKKNNREIWKYYSKRMAALDRSLTHPKNDPSYSKQSDEKPPVIFPKLFRRLWTFEIGESTRFSTQGYQKFLVKSADKCCQTSTFLHNGYPSKNSPNLSDFVAQNGGINFDPAEIVFKEAGTSLKDKSGIPIRVF
jgi:endonuclease YncB( thermonuclease family)